MAEKPLVYGSKFRSTSTLGPIFENHPFCPSLKHTLMNDVDFPLKDLTPEKMTKGIIDAIEFGNHKGIGNNPDLLESSMRDKVSQG